MARQRFRDDEQFDLRQRQVARHGDLQRHQRVCERRSTRGSDEIVRRFAARTLLALRTATDFGNLYGQFNALVFGEIGPENDRKGDALHLPRLRAAAQERAQKHQNRYFVWTHARFPPFRSGAANSASIRTPTNANNHRA